MAKNKRNLKSKKKTKSGKKYCSPGNKNKKSYTCFNKKSLRKNKILKVLISKYLRKFLLILQLKYVSLHFSSTPIMLQEIILNLTTPLIKPLKNPLTLKVIDEDQSSQFRFIFLYFFFQKSKNFGTFKLRRKGRVKRRIIRKLIKINNVLD